LDRVDSLLCLYVKVRKEIIENFPLDCFTHTGARESARTHRNIINFTFLPKQEQSWWIFRRVSKYIS